MGSSGLWDCGRAAPDLTFCPQPSQDTKVRVALPCGSSDTFLGQWVGGWGVLRPLLLSAGILPSRGEGGPRAVPGPRRAWLDCPGSAPCPPLGPHCVPAKVWQVKGGGGHGRAAGGLWGEGPMPESPTRPASQGLACVSTRLRLVERRQQRLREVQAKHEHLCEELAETQGRLMLEPGRWLEQCESRLPTDPAWPTMCPDARPPLPSPSPVALLYLLSRTSWWEGWKAGSAGPRCLSWGLWGARWLPPASGLTQVPLPSPPLPS